MVTVKLQAFKIHGIRTVNQLLLLRRILETPEGIHAMKGLEVHFRRIPAHSEVECN